MSTINTNTTIRPQSVPGDRPAPARWVRASQAAALTALWVGLGLAFPMDPRLYLLLGSRWSSRSSCWCAGARSGISGCATEIGSASTAGGAPSPSRSSPTR